MKTFIHLIFLLMACITLQGQIYVDIDATGANDGTSWTDAYTDLNVAIGQASLNDEIWVAEGTYTPGDTSTVFFILAQDVQLYGGFNGTETQLDQRDPALYPTILSGDINGDDLPGDFVNNRADNAYHVLAIDFAITPATIIDGFTISGGHAGVSNQEDGGGLICGGSPLIRHCLFTDNYAQGEGGGASIKWDQTTRLVLDSCRFISNFSATRGGGMAFRDSWSQTQSDTAQVRNCLFAMNRAASVGGGIRAISSTLLILGCRFDNNTSDNIGGGLSCFQTANSLTVRVDSCEFLQNNAVQGGGMFYQPRGSANTLSLTQNTFIENGAQTRGGGFYAFYDPSSTFCPMAIQQCIFERNQTGQFGGGMTLIFEGTDGEVEVEECLFEGNITTNQPSGLGAAIYATSNNQMSSLNISKSSIKDNVGDLAGAVAMEILPGGQLDSRIRDCDFRGNKAVFSAAGLGFIAYPGSLGSDLQVEDCAFTENRIAFNPSPSFGGGIALASGTGAFAAHINRCTFKGNQNLTGGAAIEYRDLPQNAQETGGWVRIENSLFTDHDSSLAVIQLSREVDPLVSPILVELNNLTIADNFAASLQSLQEVPVILRNNIFNSSFQRDVEIGTHSLIASDGGNVISDSSANSFLLATDQSEVDPLFTRTEPHPYQLQWSSPAVNRGQIWAGFDGSGGDVLGNTRIEGQLIDAGAYESPFSVSIAPQIRQHEALSLYPNPVQYQAHIKLENNWQGKVDVLIYNLSGQQVWQDQFIKLQSETEWSLMLPPLPSGAYQMVLSNGQQIVQTRFVKE
ncbi:MAG: T9SS type A sorting domain-containing protein [Bacteroidota bacterium]